MRFLRNLLLALLGFALLMGALVAVSNIQTHPKTATKPKLQVVATFYPMAEFARAVGGSNVEVTTLVKPGQEPHDYEPSPQDLAKIYKSDMFVYNGAGLEDSWVNKIQKQLENSNTFTVDASYRISLLKKDPSDTENKSATDPHVWMDPELAIHEISIISTGFLAVDGKNASTYQANADAYIKKLSALDTAFKTGLSQCQSHAIVTSHQAFSYLAKEYGLQAMGIAGLSPDDEPSPEKLAQVADFAKANNLKYIFYESQSSPKLSQTVANEIGGQTIAFSPLESLTDAQQKAGQNYLTVQQDNLQALRTALGCQ
jgi:zinc transport system substrate-binding protein